MGVHRNISYSHFPKSGAHMGWRVKVAFNYNTDDTLKGIVVRDDGEEPYVTIIRLDDGRHVLATECHYSEVIMEKAERPYTKEHVDNLFKMFGTLTVTFTKRDGSERKMVCTKDLLNVPHDKRPKGDVQRTPNPDVATVFEIGNDWRSFRYDSVKLIEYEKIDL